jgi:putative DNA methylase
MSYQIKSPRKLIEVALPLDAISAEASLRKRKAPMGYPTALHKWWAQRPPAAVRAVIFAQIVNDPGYQQGGGFKYGKNKKEAAIERKRLFKIIEDLVLWENTTNEEVLERARAEIRRSWREDCDLNKDHPQATVLFNPEKLPALRDPFAGGGTIPLEAQRLGLEAYASDLNPVAVLINKAMIEIPPKFTGRPPVHPSDNSQFSTITSQRAWLGATGLAEDVRHYGEWVLAEAQKRIGHLYPPIAVTAKMVCERPDLKPLVGRKLSVVAWLWARTVKSKNPAFGHVDVPLSSTFILSSGKDKEIYVEPVVDGDSYTFKVRVGKPPLTATGGTTAGKKEAFRCLLSNAPMEYDYIRAESQAGRMGQKLMAVVAEGSQGRVYLSPTPEHEVIAQIQPTWKPEVEIVPGMSERVVGYGFRSYAHLFTSRQLVALATFSDLVQEASERVKRDALSAGVPTDGQDIDSGVADHTAYAEAISVYLAFAQSRAADYGCSLATWRHKDNAMRSGMAKQALPMIWDFAEGNPFGDSSASFRKCIDVVAKVILTSLGASHGRRGRAELRDAAQADPLCELPVAVISTDPPYYDNIGYADLSDFFYVWLRRNLRSTYSNLFATIAVPKDDELVATPARHGGKAGAQRFFLEGMTLAMSNLAARSHPAFPISIYYAFKQSETKDAGTASTGWDTFLAAVIRSGLSITGTWPVRTEGDNRQVGVGKNALASSIVMICRKRPADAPSISRREFIRELNGVLPEALDEMTKGSGDERSPVAPVDLSQAIIGPGMAVFSKYAAVLEADGSPMSVRTALQLINRFLAEDDFDADTQFCLHWFEQHGWIDGVYGEADTLSRGKGTTVDGMKEAGVLKSGGGKVRLLKWADYPTDWDPRTDKRTPVWEALHQLIRALKQGGESASGALLSTLGGKAEAVRQLAYRLYTLCERLGQAEDARAYNELITSWTGIESAASERKPVEQQLPGVEN